MSSDFKKQTPVVRRDARGRLLPGSQLVKQSGAEHLVGREPTRPDSIARAALGLPSRVTEWERRKKQEQGNGR